VNCGTAWGRKIPSGRIRIRPGRIWHDLRFKDLYRSGEEFELMTRAMGFAALAILTVIPLLIVVAAADPAPERGLAVWVIDGMGLSGSSADAVALVFSAPGRVLGTTSVFGVLLVGVFGVSFAGSVQAGFERIWGCPAGPWHKIWRQAVWLAALLALWVPNTVSLHATWAYSWIRLPSRSRRRTRILEPAADGSWRPAGGFWCRARCGRWPL